MTHTLIILCAGRLDTDLSCIEVDRYDFVEKMVLQKLMVSKNFTVKGRYIFDNTSS